MNLGGESLDPEHLKEHAEGYIRHLKRVLKVVEHVDLPTIYAVHRYLDDETLDFMLSQLEIPTSSIVMMYSDEDLNSLKPILMKLFEISS